MPFMPFNRYFCVFVYKFVFLPLLSQDAHFAEYSPRCWSKWLCPRPLPSVTMSEPGSLTRSDKITGQSGWRGHTPSSWCHSSLILVIINDAVKYVSHNEDTEFHACNASVVNAQSYSITRSLCLIVALTMSEVDDP